MRTTHPFGIRTAAAVLVALAVVVVLSTSRAQQVPQWEYGVLSVEEFFGEQGESVGITTSYAWTAAGEFHTGETLASLLAELSGSKGTDIDLYNYLGQQGWELVTIASRPPRPVLSGSSELPQGMLITDIQWIFKRPAQVEQ